MHSHIPLYFPHLSYRFAPLDVVFQPHNQIFFKPWEDCLETEHRRYTLQNIIRSIRKQQNSLSFKSWKHAVQRRGGGCKPAELCRANFWSRSSLKRRFWEALLSPAQPRAALMLGSIFPFFCLQRGYFHPVKAEVLAFWQHEKKPGCLAGRMGSPCREFLPWWLGKRIPILFLLYKMPPQGTKNTEGGDKGMIRWLEQHFFPPWFDSLSSNPGVG